jgi:hypothetical protein
MADGAAQNNALPPHVDRQEIEGAAEKLGLTPDAIRRSLEKAERAATPVWTETGTYQKYCPTCKRVTTHVRQVSSTGQMKKQYYPVQAGGARYEPVLARRKWCQGCGYPEQVSVRDIVGVTVMIAMAIVVVLLIVRAVFW